jgi:hypothetical protein
VNSPWMVPLVCASCASSARWTTKSSSGRSGEEDAEGVRYSSEVTTEGAMYAGWVRSG